MAISFALESGSSLRGIACMLVAGIFLTVNDSIMKWLAPHYPVGEILFVQATLIALMVAAWMRLRGEHPLAIVRWRDHCYRGLMYATGSFAFVYALRHLPLDVVHQLGSRSEIGQTAGGVVGDGVGVDRSGVDE